MSYRVVLAALMIAAMKVFARNSLKDKGFVLPYGVEHMVEKYGWKELESVVHMASIDECFC